MKYIVNKSLRGHVTDVRCVGAEYDMVFCHATFRPILWNRKTGVQINIEDVDLVLNDHRMDYEFFIQL